MLWINLAGYAASSMVLATFCMKTMRPLRILALASNVLFAVYAFFGGLYPVLILHVVLFPINLARLVQLQRLTPHASRCRGRHRRSVDGRSAAFHATPQGPRRRNGVQ